MKKLTLIVTMILALAGCRNTGMKLLPSVSGKAGEVLIIMDKPLWEGALGEEVRNVMAADVPYLAQQEPYYTLVNVVPSGFGDLFKPHRNIVIFNVNPQNDTMKVDYGHDIWSAPQCIIQLNAYTEEDAIELFRQKSTMMMSSLEQAERDRVIRNSKRYEETSIAKKMKAFFGGSPHFPTGYKIRKADENFAWIADNKTTMSQNVLIFRYPVIEENPLSQDCILRNVNQILQENVPGMVDGSYMMISEYFPVTSESIHYRGRDFVQTRGMWDVHGDFMGGPFVSHSFYNEDGSEIIVAMAFIYVPNEDKRQFLRQTESILYSWD